MSNGSEDKIKFYWHQIGAKEKALLTAAFVLWTLFAFGMGLVLKGDSEKAPIIIEKCSECPKP